MVFLKSQTNKQNKKKPNIKEKSSKSAKVLQINAGKYYCQAS